MDLNLLDFSIKVAACVCGKDGVISKSEENEIFRIVNSINESFCKDRFERIINEYFDESHHIEYYLSKIINYELKKFTIDLCRKSASIDGLEIKENIALDKVVLILDV